MESSPDINNYVSAELSLLIPEFRKPLVAAIAATKERGVQVEPIRTLVSPLEQACLWKQGRSAADAELKSLALDHAKAPYLANILRASKARETNLATDGIPGTTWANWGESAQVVWIDGSRKVNLSPLMVERPLNKNGYVVFGEECVKLGLYMSVFCEVQLRREPSPLDFYTMLEIDTEMQKRFGR